MTTISLFCSISCSPQYQGLNLTKAIDITRLVNFCRLEGKGLTYYFLQRG